MKGCLLIIWFALLAEFSYGRELGVCIYSDLIIKQFSVKVLNGSYMLLDKADSAVVATIAVGDSMSVQAFNGQMKIWKDTCLLGVFDSVGVTGSGFPKQMRVQVIQPAGQKSRVYEDSFKILARFNQLFVINQIDLERYVSGVVEAEAGSCSDNLEFFKVQSIICRTYAVKNIGKHILDGFHLCDQVHCQVYKGKCIDRKNLIMRATYQTAGEVIVDTGQALISATFHSNSGGQTINSEDVWLSPASYLRGKTDTFSLHMPHASWDRRIKKTDWLNYLKQNYNYPVEVEVHRQMALSYSQQPRQAKFHSNIPLKQIRHDYGLKSTYFSVSDDGEYVILKGRGYGHGVGLSQEGAIKMANLGYSCDSIIQFYYTGVRLINSEDLQLKTAQPDSIK